MVPGGGFDPPRREAPADFKSAASAISPDLSRLVFENFLDVNMTLFGQLYQLSSESCVLQGGFVESGCTMLYCLCGNDNQVLRLEHQVCAVPKGRRGPDRL
jgi:hypothetical protein